jgi:hypothetical protein
MLYEHTDVCGSHRAKRALLVGLLAITCFGLVTVARPAPASADIPWPYQFMPYIDDYQPYQGQTTCSMWAKPGVIAFRDLLNFWFGPHNYGIVAQGGCDPGNPIHGNGGQGEHKEGRALDYMAAVNDPASWRIIDWITRSDEYGNPYALGRRFGLMYIVWNHQMFRFYPPRGWAPYTGSNPHTDHIHFSFSWAGALKQTSWWTTTQQTRTGCGASIQTWVFGSGYGPLVQIKRIQDSTGRVFDTQSEIQNSYWRVEASGHVYRANQPLSVLATGPRPRAKIAVPTPYGAGWCYVNLT